jgi:hypothetical protein
MGENVLASNPAQGPGGLQGLVARWNDLAKPWRLNVVLYSLTALSLVALVFELVAGEDTAPKANVASQAPIVPTTTPSTVVALPTTSPSTSSTTSSTVAPTSTTRAVVRTTVFEPDPEPEPEPDPEPEETTTTTVEETTTTTEPATTTTTEAPTTSSSTPTSPVP